MTLTEFLEREEPVNIDEVIKGLQCLFDPNNFNFKRCHTCRYRKDIDHLQYVCDDDKCIADVIALMEELKQIKSRETNKDYSEGIENEKR